jgi:SAM-dependent MidA family methyltransferase
VGEHAVTPVEVLVRERIAARGPLPWSEVVDLALYDPDHGFYAAGRGAGRRRDFLTSPEVGPLFGAVVARALDSWWDAAGRPDRWTVVEVGAGPGTLARTVAAAAPRCAAALTYVQVDRAAPAPDHPGGVPAEGPVTVLANELLDNVPFDLAERVPAGWAEVRVGLADGALAEVLAPFDRLPEACRSVEAPVGARVPIQGMAQAWLAEALALARPEAGGRVVLLDYAGTTPALAERPQEEWLRTYRGHARGGAPLARLGEQDITCEVCVDQLAQVAPPTADRSQAAWLAVHGIGELVDEGRRVWAERAHLGDLEAVRARSRVTEAEALLDPRGLGAFRVLEWGP